MVGQDGLAAERELADVASDIAMTMLDMAHQTKLHGKTFVALLAAVILDSAVNLLMVDLQRWGTVQHLAALLAADGSLFGVDRVHVP